MPHSLSGECLFDPTSACPMPTWRGRRLTGRGPVPRPAPTPHLPDGIVWGTPCCTRS